MLSFNIFHKELYDLVLVGSGGCSSKLFLSFLDKIERTVEIEASTVEIEERGVKLRLTVVDTPGYGDAMNCEDWLVKVILVQPNLLYQITGV